MGTASVEQVKTAIKKVLEKHGELDHFMLWFKVMSFLADDISTSVMGKALDDLGSNGVIKDKYGAVRLSNKEVDG